MQKLNLKARDAARKKFWGLGILGGVSIECYHIFMHMLAMTTATNSFGVGVETGPLKMPMSKSCFIVMWQTKRTL